MKYLTVSTTRNVIVAGAVIVAVLISSFAVAQDVGVFVRTFSGRYRNPQYGYSFAIPHGFTCQGASVPAPAHGCVISVGEKNDTVDVAAYYTMAEDPFEYFGEIAEDFKKGMSEVSEDVQKPATLGGVGAVGAVLYWKDRGQPRGKRVLVAIRRGIGDSPPIAYTLQSNCSMKALRRCSEVFESVVRSFVLIPLS